MSTFSRILQRPIARLALALPLGLIVLALILPDAKPSAPLTIGFVELPNQPFGKDALKQYLEEELNREIEVKTLSASPTVVKSAKKSIKSQEFDVLFSTGAVLAASAEANDYTFVAPMNSGKVFQSVLYVPRNSPIRSEGDFQASTTIAIGEFGNLATNYMPLYDLYGRVVSLKVGNSVRDIPKMLASQQADVGVGVYQMFEKKPELKEKFRIIYRSRDLPMGSVYLAPKLSKKDSKSISNALLKAPLGIQSANYYTSSFNSQPDYSIVSGIVQRAEEVISCISEWESKPVRVYGCETQDSDIKPPTSQLKETGISISESSELPGAVGRVNGVRFIESNSVRLQVMNSKAGIQNYYVVIPYSLIQTDTSLPSEVTQLHGKIIQIEGKETPENGDLEIKRKGEIRLYDIEQ